VPPDFPCKFACAGALGRGSNERLQVYVSPTQVWVNPTQVCVNPAQVYVNPAQLWVNPTQVWVNPTCMLTYQVWVNPTQVYVNPAQVYVNPAQVWVNPTQVWVNPTCMLKLQVYVNPAQLWVNPAQVWVNPTKVYVSPTHLQHASVFFFVVARGLAVRPGDGGQRGGAGAELHEGEVLALGGLDKHTPPKASADPRLGLGVSAVWTEQSSRGMCAAATLCCAPLGCAVLETET
jgi:hypothetical protein